jgi:CheY-like chemotaxis protein
MGGHIYVKSETSVGTEFSFSLPFVKTTEAEPSKAYTANLEPVNSANKTILIVEDNPLNQKLTSIILNNNGFNFLMAGNGLEAIEILKTHSADLILMDIQMPVMDGYEATCYIRDEMHINIPIVAITAHALAAEKEKCIQKGINDYLPKPFSEADLLKTISYWISKNKITQSCREEKLTDLSFLQNQTRNNEAVIKEIITLFINQNPQDIAGLNASIEAGDYKAVYKQAHSLKSGLALFGLDKHARESLTKLEAIAHEEGPVEEMKAHFAAIENCCNQALQELKNELT